MNEFTKGECKADGTLVYVDAGVQPHIADLSGYTDNAEANAALIAACFTSATCLAEAGYDAQAVMEALPEIVADWCDWTAHLHGGASVVAQLLARIRPEASHDEG